MKNDRYLVSIILSVYNGEKYLANAIESLLAQTCESIKIIIVNDGSTDRTEEIAKYYSTQYFSLENRGQPAAQNFALKLVETPYVGFLDADDLQTPEKTAIQLDFLQAHPEYDFIFGHVEQFFSPEISSETRKKWVCPSKISPGYLAGAGLFRKTCFDRVGLFNEQQRIGAFLEWYMRAEEKGLKHKIISDKVLLRRIHENNMGIYSQNSRMEYIQIVKNALKRRQTI